MLFSLQSYLLKFGLKKDGNKVFRGDIKEYIWNKTAAVMEITNLDKGEDYNEVSLKDYNRFNNGKNHMLILPTHLWNYEEVEYKLELSDSPTSLIETKSVKKIKLM